MSKLTIINTGGTFNKIYNPISGELEVAKDAKIIKELLKNFPNLSCELVSILHKDSLEMIEADRFEILEVIKKSKNDKFLIIHGTDTMDVTAKFLDSQIKDKTIILTGAMVPFSISTIEASCNFATALGYLLSHKEKGIYIGMHGLIKAHDKVVKNRSKGVFEPIL